MKLKILLSLMLCIVIFAGKARATAYTLGPGDYTGGLTLDDSDTLLMTGGTCESLSMSNNAIATIVDTAPLGEISTDGGIWGINGGGQELNIIGGEIREIETKGDLVTNVSGGYIKDYTIQSRSFLNISGGQIDLLRSEQTVPWGWTSPDSEYVPFPYINVICRDWSWEETTNVLTGTWEDYSTFNIQLEDVAGFDDAIGNIKFTIVPEPVSLVLLGLGSLIVRAKR